MSYYVIQCTCCRNPIRVTYLDWLDWNHIGYKFVCTECDE